MLFIIPAIAALCGLYAVIYQIVPASTNALAGLIVRTISGGKAPVPLLDASSTVTSSVSEYISIPIPDAETFSIRDAFLTMPTGFLTDPTRVNLLQHGDATELEGAPFLSMGALITVATLFLLGAMLAYLFRQYSGCFWHGVWQHVLRESADARVGHLDAQIRRQVAALSTREALLQTAARKEEELEATLLAYLDGQLILERTVDEQKRELQHLTAIIDSITTEREARDRTIAWYADQAEQDSESMSHLTTKKVIDEYFINELKNDITVLNGTLTMTEKNLAKSLAAPPDSILLREHEKVVAALKRSNSDRIDALEKRNDAAIRALGFSNLQKNAVVQENDKLKSEREKALARIKDLESSIQAQKRELTDKYLDSQRALALAERRVATQKTRLVRVREHSVATTSYCEARLATLTETVNSKDREIASFQEATSKVALQLEEERATSALLRDQVAASELELVSTKTARFDAEALVSKAQEAIEGPRGYLSQIANLEEALVRSQRPISQVEEKASSTIVQPDKSLRVKELENALDEARQSLAAKDAAIVEIKAEAEQLFSQEKEKIKTEVDQLLSQEKEKAKAIEADARTTISALQSRIAAMDLEGISWIQALDEAKTEAQRLLAVKDEDALGLSTALQQAGQSLAEKALETQTFEEKLSRSAEDLDDMTKVAKDFEDQTADLMKQLNEAAEEIEDLNEKLNAADAEGLMRDLESARKVASKAKFDRDTAVKAHTKSLTDVLTQESRANQARNEVRGLKEAIREQQTRLEAGDKAFWDQAARIQAGDKAFREQLSMLQAGDKAFKEQQVRLQADQKALKEQQVRLDAGDKAFKEHLATCQAPKDAKVDSEHLLQEKDDQIRKLEQEVKMLQGEVETMQTTQELSNMMNDAFLGFSTDTVGTEGLTFWSGDHPMQADADRELTMRDNLQGGLPDIPQSHTFDWQPNTLAATFPESLPGPTPSTLLVPEASGSLRSVESELGAASAVLAPSTGQPAGRPNRIIGKPPTNIGTSRRQVPVQRPDQGPQGRRLAMPKGKWALPNPPPLSTPQPPPDPLSDAQNADEMADNDGEDNIDVEVDYDELYGDFWLAPRFAKKKDKGDMEDDVPAEPADDGPAKPGNNDPEESEESEEE